MKSELTIKKIKRLLDAFVGRKCVCILGAGVSDPMVPRDLNSRVLDKILQFTNAIEPGMQGRTPQSRSWVKPTSYEWSVFVRAAIGQQTVEAYRLWEHEVTKPLTLASAPAQYAVFRFMSQWITLLTFNYDGLAKRFCPQHVVREMHGRHSPEFPYGWDLSELHQYAVRGYDIAPNSFHSFEAEPLGFYGVREECWFSQLLSDCSDLVIIGYSFAQQGQRLNDQETFNMICRYLHKNARITVVGPNVEYLVLRLQEGLKTNDVVGVPAYWNHLARAIMRVSNRTIEGDIRGAQRFPNNVYENYSNFLNSSHRDLERLVEIVAELPNISISDFEAKKNYIDAHR